MSEIDLIPTNYKNHIWKIKNLRNFLLALILLVVSTGTAYAALAYANKKALHEIDDLRKFKDILFEHDTSLKLLQSEKKQLDDQWTLLTSLRSSASPEDIFISVDQAIQDINIWFTNINFKRSEHVGIKENEVNTGYFIILQEEEGVDSFAIGTKMSIQGAVKNHASLSKFVDYLLDQNGILEARVVETSMNQYGDKLQIINFTVDITINPSTRES